MVLNSFQSTNISLFLCVVTAVPLFLAIPNIKESLLRPEAELTFRKKPTVIKMKFMMVHDYQELLKVFVQIPSNLLKPFPTDVSNWVPKTAAEIEEERTIKEICYKTGKYEISHSFLKTNDANILSLGFIFPLALCLGEYYRIQHPHKDQSTETVSSAQEKEILLLEAMERDLEKGK